MFSTPSTLCNPEFQFIGYIAPQTTPKGLFDMFSSAFVASSSIKKLRNSIFAHFDYHGSRPSIEIKLVASKESIYSYEIMYRTKKYHNKWLSISKMSMNISVFIVFHENAKFCDSCCGLWCWTPFIFFFFILFLQALTRWIICLGRELRWGGGYRCGGGRRVCGRWLHGCFWGLVCGHGGLSVIRGRMIERDRWRGGQRRWRR